MNTKKKIYQSHFKVPKGYFEGLEDSVMSEIIAESLPENSGFEVPDAYFNNEIEINLNQDLLPKSNSGFVLPGSYFEEEHIENNVFVKLTNAKPSKAGKMKRLVIERLIPLTIAASLALFVYITFDDSMSTIDSFVSSDLEEWIDDGLITINESDITEIYADVEFTNDQYFSDEDVIEYLDGTDIELLLTEE